MAKAGQRKCMSCGEFFLPDHRSGDRQRYCCAAACRRASKAASQASWLPKPPNHDYFSGPTHVTRVQAWRDAHPGYSRGRERPSRALQDLLPPQVPDPIEECANRVEAPEVGAAVALQDLLTAESPLLAGLVTARARRDGRSDQRPAIASAHDCRLPGSVLVPLSRTSSDDQRSQPRCPSATGCCRHRDRTQGWQTART